MLTLCLCRSICETEYQFSATNGSNPSRFAILSIVLFKLLGSVWYATIIEVRRMRREAEHETYSQLS